MRLAFDDATLIVEPETPETGLALGVDVPRFPEGSKSAVADLPPAGGLTLLHELPAIGNKFDAPEELGPSAAASTTTGDFQGTVVLSLGER